MPFSNWKSMKTERKTGKSRDKTSEALPDNPYCAKPFHCFYQICLWIAAQLPIWSSQDIHSRSVLESYVEKKNSSALITLTIGPASHADSCQKHHVIPLNSVYSGLEGTSRWHHTYLPPFQSNKRSPKHPGAQNKKKPCLKMVFLETGK